MHTEILGMYVTHRQGLFTLALSITGCGAAAEDAVHDAFGRLLERGVPDGADAAAYVFGAVRNAAIDRRRVHRPAPLDDGSLFDGRADADPGAPLAADDEATHVRAAVDRLPEDLKQVLVMRVYGGLTFQQIADAHDAPLSTIASRYGRALDTLRAALGDQP